MSPWPSGLRRPTISDHLGEWTWGVKIFFLFFYCFLMFFNAYFIWINHQISFIFNLTLKWHPPLIKVPTVCYYVLISLLLKLRTGRMFGIIQKVAHCSIKIQQKQLLEYLNINTLFPKSTKQERGQDNAELYRNIVNTLENHLLTSTLHEEGWLTELEGWIIERIHFRSIK